MGGTEAVAFFFVLSGFVEALHLREDKLRLRNVLRICVKKVHKFYRTHVVFLVFTIPTMIYMVLTDPIGSFIKFIINALLLQSWFPNEHIWLSYNSVTWFLSTLVFLCIFIIPLHHICSYIEKHSHAVGIYAVILVVDWLMVFAVAFLLSTHCDNIQYYLYAFPPIRLMDYTSGFVLGRVFVHQRNNKSVCRKATYLEIAAVGVIMGYLMIFPYVPEAFSRAAIYQPGAAFVIYVFAMGKGTISHFLSSPPMVRLGGNTLYYMISHQVIIRYCQLFHKQLVKRELYSLEIVWIIMALVLTLISKPIYEILCNKILEIRKSRVCEMYLFKNRKEKV